MRKTICIEIPIDYCIDINAKLTLLCNDPFAVGLSDIIHFNHVNTHIRAIKHSINRDCIHIYLIHNEFMGVMPGMATPIYWLEDAKRLFPYLFYDTNPILYRRFYSNWRHSNGKNRF